MPLGGSDQRLLEAASGDGLITTEKTGLGLARVTGAGGVGMADGKGVTGGRVGSRKHKGRQNPQTESSMHFRDWN